MYQLRDILQKCTGNFFFNVLGHVIRSLQEKIECYAWTKEETKYFETANKHNANKQKKQM